MKGDRTMKYNKIQRFAVIFAMLLLERYVFCSGLCEEVYAKGVEEVGVETEESVKKETDFCEHQINEEQDWTYIKYATPLEAGIRYKHCCVCGNAVIENYTMLLLENNSVYITGTDIKECFTISSFTQSAVDKYDIVYTEVVAFGTENSFILGHRYRTLGKLYQTKVGERIYLNVEGKIEIYEVVVSEYGLETSSRRDIIGQTTNASIWDNYDCKTLHLYTCYGKNKNGRWIVLAKKIF